MVAAGIIYATYDATTDNTYISQADSHSSTATTTPAAPTPARNNSTAAPCKPAEQTMSCTEDNTAMQNAVAPSAEIETTIAEPAEHMANNETNTIQTTTDYNSEAEQPQVAEQHTDNNPTPSHTEQTTVDYNSNNEQTTTDIAQNKTKQNNSTLPTEQSNTNTDDNEIATPVTQNNTSNNDNDLYIPSGFTPDQPENNMFYVKGKNIKEYEIRIYSKQGIMVYSSKDINEKWDGRFNGELLEMGAYVYVITYTTTDNKINQIINTITLIRTR
jgi:gliding motility-associated-like protein